MFNSTILWLYHVPYLAQCIQNFVFCVCSMVVVFTVHGSCVNLQASFWLWILELPVNQPRHDFFFTSVLLTIVSNASYAVVYRLSLSYWLCTVETYKMNNFSSSLSFHSFEFLIDVISSQHHLVHTSFRILICLNEKSSLNSVHLNHFFDLK